MSLEPLKQKGSSKKREAHFIGELVIGGYLGNVLGWKKKKELYVARIFT